MKKFGELVAINNLDFKVEKREIRGLIGPNGSGKTTLLNMISGLYSLDGGNIYLNGERIDGLPPNIVAKRGVARTFQIRKLFRSMTVLENLLVPAIATGSHHDLIEAKEKALEVLEFLQIERLKDEYAKNLSGGQQQLLEIGRGLMMTPILFLMDEPFAGVNPVIKEQIMGSINRMNEEGVTFIVVSHEMPSVAYICKKVTVLDRGVKIAEGTMEEISEVPEVIEAYLGG
ncbi:MAG: ABC transporter ATP-binding protein [Candidatus Geothermarchaeales archaeon]